MVPPAPFQGSASAVDGSGGGGGSSVTGGLSSVDDIGDITGGTPTRLTNMAVAMRRADAGGELQRRLQAR
jgi:hypothetical protein